MAAALLRARLDEDDVGLRVASAGFMSDGAPAPPEVLDVMAAIGIDLSDHRSRLVRPELLAAADLIIGMTRQHVIDVADRMPDVWVRTFTLAEIGRRGENLGPRRQGETLSQWVSRLHGGRTRASILSLPLADDIPDPMGRRLRAYQRTRDVLTNKVEGLAALIVPA
jgi:protein-tyrosine-phosphatase